MSELKTDNPINSHPPDHSSPVQAPEIDPQYFADLTGRGIERESRVAVLFRHSGWTHTRRLIAESLSRTNQTFAREYEFRNCGIWAFVVRSVDDPEKYRIAGSCCRDRFCLPCATERSHVIANNVVDHIGDGEVRFLTLTIKTGSEPLADQLDKLYGSFQALRRRKFWKRAVHGGVAFLELKWSNTGDRWHPHLHCLLQGTWIDKAVLVTAWKAITGDSYVLDIRKPPNATAVARYAAKYASKPFNSTYVGDPDHLDEAVLALAGRKLAVTFGTWRGLLLTATPDEGTWEHVGSLDQIICSAAHGNLDAIHIMAKLTDRDLTQLYARAPPIELVNVATPKRDDQATFFGAWQANASYKYPAE